AGARGCYFGRNLGHNPSIPRFKCIAKRRSHIILRILICHSIVRERWTLTLPIFGLVVVSVDERQDAVSSSNRSRPEDTWRVMQEKIHCNAWPQKQIFEKSAMRIGQIRYSQVSSGACSNSQAVKSSRDVKLSNSSINCSSFSI